MTNIRHDGLNKNRLNREPDEAAYAKAWEKIAPTTLGYLLCGQDRDKHDYSQRDAEVAATVIQWLGSHVGENFLFEVQDSIKRSRLLESKERAKELKHFRV